MLQPVCHFFVSTGKCKFGKHCKFLHPVSSPPESQPSDQPPCRESSKLESDNTVEPVVSNTTSTQVDKCHDEAVKEEDKFPSRREICQSYLQYKFCKYGRRCRYDHILSNPGPEKTVKEQAKDSEKVRKGPVCRFFQRGTCRFGSKCRFYHPVAKATENLDGNTESSVRENETQSNYSTQDAQIQSDPVLAELEASPVYVEAEDNPAQGDNQRPGNNGTSQGRYNRGKYVGSGRFPIRRYQAPVGHTRQDVTAEQLKKLRETEIQQVTRRFPGEKLKVVQDAEDVSTFTFNFSSSDPDWPYDVKVFELEVSFPITYPMMMFTVVLPVDQDLPETVRRYVEVSIQEWLQRKAEDLEKAGKVELAFRPFLKWLDRNLEDTVTEGLKQMRRELMAKAAGFEFIPASSLQKKRQESEETVESDESGSNTDQSGDDEQPLRDGYIYRKSDCGDQLYEGPESDTSDSEDSDVEDDGTGQRPLMYDKDRRGTEITLRNLQLLDNTATLMMEKIHLSVQCERCKSKTEFSTTADKVNAVVCMKCGANQLVKFRSVMAHQYSSVVGYLDLDGCSAFDLILPETVCNVGCFHCSKNMIVKSLSTGKLLDMPCRSCHHKMRLAVDAVHFRQLLPSSVSTESGKVREVIIERKKKVVKDPAIQEGRPLPEFGTCKHYKKSFRWLRFPCCGKCYPCDVCHDEKEGGGHEMKYANRMICGFCCREQPYAVEKPCIACSSAMTKSSTSHWEGGKGCRDKIKMSRNDNQKYSSVNKTVSNRASAKQQKTGKKTTKLRHA